MEKEKLFKPVKEFAELKKQTVQAVYQGIKRGMYESKKIGTYTLVRDRV